MAKIIVIVIFIGILASLAAAFRSLMQVKRDDASATARALTVRIGLSLMLFVLLFVLWALGVIEPSHGPVGFPPGTSR